MLLSAAVGALEVWAGNIDLSGNPSNLYNVNQNGYTQLGVSNTANGQDVFSTGGTPYNYFVIVTRGQVQVDAVQGSNSTYLSTIESTGSTSDNGGNMTGAPDGNYTAIGTQVSFSGTFAGYAEFANPGAWTSLTVDTGSIGVMLQGQVSVDNSYLPGAATPYSYNSQLEVDDNGLITSGEVQAPTGVWYPLALESGQGNNNAQWRFQDEFSSQASQSAAFPNGTYTFLVNSPLGTTVTQFAYTKPSLAAVPAPIGLTDGSTGVSTSNTFTWNAISDSNANDQIELQIDGPNGENTLVDQQLATSATNYGPVALAASSNYEEDLRLNSNAQSTNADGFSFNAGITNETDLLFTTAASASAPKMNFSLVGFPAGTIQPGDWINLPITGSNAGGNAIGSSSGNVVGIVYEADLSTTQSFGAGNILLGQNSINSPGFIGGESFSPGKGGPQVQIPTSVTPGNYYIGLKLDTTIPGNTGTTALWSTTELTISANGTLAVTAPAAQSAYAGASHAFALGSFTQANAIAPFLAEVNWGDGSNTTFVPVTAAGTIPATAHTYASTGNEIVTVKVYDWDGEATPKSFTFGVSVTTVPLASIAGTIYGDTGDTGVYNSADPDVNDVMVYLDANHNGQLDAGEISVNTNSSGNYLFSNLAAGNYTVRQVAPGGYVQTYPAAGSISVTVTAGQASTGNTFLDAPTGNATQEAVYRLYSPVTLEHLYTTDPNEYNTLESYVGTWNGEGEVFNEYSGPATVGGVADEPFYRLYNPFVKQHLWTTDLNEYTVLATEGWNQENIVGYVFPAASGATATSLPTVPDSQALYRLMAPQVHLWTTSQNEYDTLQTEGWTAEGIIGYVV